jgi:hypothetical protein
MVPEVVLLQPIIGKDADVFMETCANFSEVGLRRADHN